MSMFAIIKTGGKQYKVSEGTVLSIEKLEHDTQEVVFKEVLLIADDKNVKVGTPILSGASVKATILDEGKGDKKRVFRYKSKTRQRKLKGHRQPFTLVKITNISA